MVLTLIASLGLSLLPQANAYAWSFQQPPQQCANLSIAVSGNDGEPPYRLLILPFGPSPLANNIEARKIMDVPFPSGQSRVQFQLKYPANSQFVAVVSDAKGFGSGGTSVTAQVLSSNDASCFDAQTSVAPLFYFSIDPPNQIVQCQDTRIYWTASNVEGTPNFVGVIPGGQSFSVPQGAITNQTNLGTGFTWKPSLRTGTTLMLVGGDSRGNGTGGSILNVVSAGTNQDGSCLSNSSPSSTPGSPAGGSYPTGSGGWTGNNGSKSSSNLGMIVGVVLGGIALIIIALLLVWFIRRRRKQQRRPKNQPVDLYADEEDGDESRDRERRRLNEQPEYYQPEPFVMTDPTAGSQVSRMSADRYSGTHTGTGTGGDERPMSGLSSSFYTRVTTPDLYGVASSAGDTAGTGTGTGTGIQGGGPSGRRKGGFAPRPLRSVNIIQHDDAGPSSPAGEGGGEGEPETIELPPAYSALKGSALRLRQEQEQGQTGIEAGQGTGPAMSEKI